MKEYAFEIIANPRIHITLMSLSGIKRIYGGVGFAINNCVRCLFKKSPELRIEGTSEENIISFCIYTDQILRQRYDIKESISFNFSQGIERHIGLGSGTLMRLSFIAAYSFLYNLNLSRIEMQVLSGRGGTSGIGINSFFDGGVICDLGRKYDGKTIDFLPSSESKNFKLPTVLFQRPIFPIKMAIYTPIKYSVIDGLSEVEFFKRTLPLSKAESDNISALVFHNLIPSILENDVNSFFETINDIQATPWKLAEINRYGNWFSNLQNVLSKNGSRMIGMSSMGPLIYCDAEFLSDELLLKVAQITNSKYEIVSPTNHGYKIEEV